MKISHFTLVGLMLLGVVIMFLLNEFRYTRINSYYPVEGFAGNPYSQQGPPIGPGGKSGPFYGGENYNHYSGTSVPMVFNDSTRQGVTATLNGNTITVCTQTGCTSYTEDSSGDNSSSSSSSSSSSTDACGNTVESFTGPSSTTTRTFFAPNGGNIILTVDTSGGYHLTETTNQNQVFTYLATIGPGLNSPVMSPLNYFSTYGGPGYSSFGPDKHHKHHHHPTTNWYGGPGPGSHMNKTDAAYSAEYMSALPQGIPASAIPPGHEDMYILKSEIVPPVCPRCPTCPNVTNTTNDNTSVAISESTSINRGGDASGNNGLGGNIGNGGLNGGNGNNGNVNNGGLLGNGSDSGIENSKCPPCPSCARCPEPSFECKKVPNYAAISSDQLPVPVLNDFSTFGM